MIKLGLIGVGIGRSRAPDLHRLAGRLCGVEVTYELLQLETTAPSAFDAALARCRSEGYRGVNVTHPFKERAAQTAHVNSDEVRRAGAVNTVRFDTRSGPQGFNTDYTGFIRAYSRRFPGRAPGIVGVVGAGGAGRAITFALIDLGAREIRLYDHELGRSESLAAALRGQAEARIVTCGSLEEAVYGTDGLVNATPVGMLQYPGTPIPGALISSQIWAFEAIYTPADTQFVLAATAAGLEVLGGYELFFYQGVDAFEIFTGLDVDEAALRAALLRSQPHAGTMRV